MKRLCELLLPSALICFSIWYIYYLEKWVPLPDYYPNLIRLMPWVFLILVIASCIGIQPILNFFKLIFISSYTYATKTYNYVICFLLITHIKIVSYKLDNNKYPYPLLYLLYEGCIYLIFYLKIYYKIHL